MQVTESEGYGYSDPIINAFRTFAQLNNIAASGSVSVVPESSHGETVANLALDHSSDLVHGAREVLNLTRTQSTSP